MCSGSSPKVPKARPIEPQKTAETEMAAASDETARRQQLRRGLMSTFSAERGLGAAMDGDTKATTLGG